MALSFAFHGPVLDQAIADVGHPPLPPYIASRREVDEQDEQDYQTMFAQTEGAVAAPTAGLHFTPALEASLRERGVSIHRITLHVGAGTFLPVKVDETAAHKMHAEWGCISADTATALNEARARGGRIVAVGTTSLRLLESAAAEDGTFRGRKELEDLYCGQAGLQASDDVIVYCRIGERSSHTWFVLSYLLGYPQVRNYDGSWTEWGNSVRVPIKRGDQP